MATQNAFKEEKKQKRANRQNLITIITVTVILLLIYGIAAAGKDAHTSWVDAFPRGWDAVSSNPLNLIYGIIDHYLIASAGIGIIIFMYFMKASDKEFRKHENLEKRSSHFMTLEELKDYNRKKNQPYGKPYNGSHQSFIEKLKRQPNKYITADMILSDDIRLSFDNEKTKLNLNVMVLGSPGTGKSFNLVAPNLLQANCCYVCTDPKGEHRQRYAKFLENQGYLVKCFDLCDMTQSHRYNFFKYIQKESDIDSVVDVLAEAVKKEHNTSNDPFWPSAVSFLVYAIIAYIWHWEPPHKQNIRTFMSMLHEAQIDENDTSMESTLDKRFKALAKEDPENIAVKKYESLKKGAAKTIASVIISTLADYKLFDSSSVQYLTDVDEMEFDKIGTRKSAVFLITPVGDLTYTALFTLITAQLFSHLFDFCSTKSEYSWCAYTDSGYLIHTEVAQGKSDKENAKRRIEELVADIHHAKGHIKANKEKGIYELYYDGVWEYEETYFNKEGKETTIKRQNPVFWHENKAEVKKIALSIKKGLKIEPAAPMGKGRLPIHTQFYLDEFANISTIPKFDDKLNVLRSYRMGCTIILQMKQQLTKHYKDSEDAILGACDTTIYLGSNDQGTQEWAVKRFGKKYIRVNNISENTGKNGGGSSSYNYQEVPLITETMFAEMEEVATIIKIKGFPSIFGPKFRADKHVNFKHACSLTGKFDITRPYKLVPPDTRPLRERQNIPQNEDEEKKKREEAAFYYARKKEQAKIAAAKAKQNQALSEGVSAMGVPEAEEPSIVEQAKSIMQTLGIDENVTKEEMMAAIEREIILESPFTQTLIYHST